MHAAAPPAASAPRPPRRRVYTAVDPRCEWASTEDADTLVVDVSGFRKEELKVLYRTNRKLKVTGERQVDGAQWARFQKVFPVPRSCDAGAIKATMKSAQLFVILPKGSSSSKGKQKEHQPGSSESLGGQKKIPGSAGGSSGSSSGSQWSAQEDLDDDKGQREDKGMEGQREDEGMEEQRQEAAMAMQDLPRSNGDANAVKNDDGDDKGEKGWWRKIRVLHVLGFVLVLALVGVGATVLYVMLL